MLNKKRMTPLLIGLLPLLVLSCWNGPLPEDQIIIEATTNALDYLASTQLEDGSWEVTAGYPIYDNLQPRTKTETAVATAGLAFLASGNYPNHLQKCVEYTIATREIPLPPGFEESRNWSLAIQGWFLAEVHLRNPTTDLENALDDIKNELLLAQQQNGSWHHFQGFLESSQYMQPNKTYAPDLTSVTSFVVFSLKRMKASGISVPGSTFTFLPYYLNYCKNIDGGLVYGSAPGFPSHPTYQTSEVGRTAMGVLALDQMGQQDSALYNQMHAYVRDNISQVEQSHGGPMLHHLMSATCAQRVGGNTKSLYWFSHSKNLLASQAADGSVPSTYMFETDIFNTAAFAIIMQLNANPLPLS